MNRIFKRGLALFIVLVMCISMLPALSIKTSAATVNYVYSGKYIYNWGTRGTDATFLSPNAEAFYAKNKSYDQLAANKGGTSQSNAPSSALYSALKNLMVSNHKTQTSYQGTRDLYRYTDCQNSGGKISSFYSGVAIGPSWDSGSTWNREHTWPNSKGLGGNDENDIMMLRPTSVSENSSRGNKAYGKSSSYYFPNSESGGKYDVRGDVARIFLYVYVRWGNTSRAWGTSGVMENVTVLLEWMEADPVDTWELGRNDSVESITGTRNVFVDYPELGFLLFGAEIPDDMQTPSGEAMDNSGNTGSGNTGSGNTGTGDNTGSGNTGAGDNTGSGNTGTGDNTGSGNTGTGDNTGSGNTGTGDNTGSGNTGTGDNTGSGNTGTGGNTDTGDKPKPNVPHTEHVYGEWETTTSPTCSFHGSERRTCTMCDEYEIREIEMLTHYDINGDDLCELCGGAMIYESEEGCQTVISGTSFWLIALISTAAVMLTKKKEY